MESPHLRLLLVLVTTCFFIYFSIFCCFSDVLLYSSLYTYIFLNFQKVEWNIQKLTSSFTTDKPKNSEAVHISLNKSVCKFLPRYI